MSYGTSHLGMQTEGQPSPKQGQPSSGKSHPSNEMLWPQTDIHHVCSQFVRASHMASANDYAQEIRSYTKYLEGRDLEISAEQHTDHPDLYLTYDHF